MIETKYKYIFLETNFKILLILQRPKVKNENHLGLHLISYPNKIILP